MKQLFIKSSLITCLLLVVAFEACSGSRPGSSGGPPAATSSSRAPVSSSAEVVKVTPSPVSIPQGGSADAVVTLSISPGFHVNANPATFSYLIATQVTPGKVEGISAAVPVYPAGVKKKFQFAEQPLAVYEGEILIKLPLRAEKNVAAGPRSLPVAVRVQACDHEQCFPPATVNATITVDVK
jgi:thiol:disulfide interchange protein DsbD